MSHFYGSIKGNRGEATRAGTKKSGYVSKAASWEGAVQVRLFYHTGVEEDWAEVRLIPWHGAGKDIILYNGPVSGRDFERFKH